MSSPAAGAQPAPDLRLGVALDLVPEDGVLGGRVADDPVILARVDGVVVAFDGACTHYSGALDQGLRVSNTINCPLHHACFDLRTGKALRAPALAPLGRWRVEEAHGQVFVRERASGVDAADAPADPTDPRAIVIVGGGAAGFAAAQRLRDLGFLGSLTMISADTDAPYDRPNVSKDYLSGEAESGWMPLKDADFYTTRRIDLRLRSRVEEIDRNTRTVRLSDGGTVAYDLLLLATGAEPNRPPTPGFDRLNVHVLRSLSDSERLIAAAAPGATAVVVGASFIGLEAAASLRTRGLTVHVVGPESVPLQSKLGEDVGALVQAVHESHGVAFHLGRRVTGFDGEAVSLDDGSRIPADLVVLGIGVRPRLELAEAAGLAIDKGVVVDANMRTSDAHILAAGDIARYPSPLGGAPIRVEHWVLAERQGQTAAAAMLGLDEPLLEAPYFWSVHYDLTIRYVGHAEAWDDIQIDGSLIGRDAEIRYRLEGRTVAVATINRDLASLEAAADLAPLAPAPSSAT